jgi:hypothetical protein
MTQHAPSWARQLIFIKPPNLSFPLGSAKVAFVGASVDLSARHAMI